MERRPEGTGWIISQPIPAILTEGERTLSNNQIGIRLAETAVSDVRPDFKRTGGTNSALQFMGAPAAGGRYQPVSVAFARPRSRTNAPGSPGEITTVRSVNFNTTASEGSET